MYFLFFVITFLSFLFMKSFLETVLVLKSCLERMIIQKSVISNQLVSSTVSSFIDAEAMTFATLLIYGLGFLGVALIVILLKRKGASDKKISEDTDSSIDFILSEKSQDSLYNIFMNGDYWLTNPIIGRVCNALFQYTIFTNLASFYSRRVSIWRDLKTLVHSSSLDNNVLEHLDVLEHLKPALKVNLAVVGAKLNLFVELGDNLYKSIHCLKEFLDKKAPLSNYGLITDLEQVLNCNLSDLLLKNLDQVDIVAVIAHLFGW